MSVVKGRGSGQRSLCPSGSREKKGDRGRKRGSFTGSSPLHPQLLYPLSEKERGRGRNIRMGTKRRLKASWRNPGFSRRSVPRGYGAALEERGRQVS